MIKIISKEKHEKLRVFKTFPKRKASDIFHKNGGVCKIGDCCKKGDITYFHTSFSLCTVSVSFSFTQLLSVFFVFHNKDLVLFNLNCNGSVDFCKINF